MQAKMCTFEIHGAKQHFGCS